MFKFLKSATLAIAAVAVVSGPVALAAGQIEGGNIYRVKNVTQNSAFADPATGTCGDTMQFRVRIHNPGPEEINNVHVAATLPATESKSHSSTVTVSASDAPDVITDTAGVNLDKAGKLNYVSGSTDLLDPNGNKLQTLSDGIVAGGVNLPTAIGVSNNQMRLVQFSAKVSCPDVPVCTVNCTPETPKTPTGVTPSAIASTGPAELFSGLAGVSALGYGVQRYVASRRQQ
jgi:uncharacterized repeat protein (TIGR01451 family)